MPELPEVETSKRGINPHIEGTVIQSVIVRNSSFRIPVPEDLSLSCLGKTIKKVYRRAKYLYIELNTGFLIIHLGMSGHLKITAQPHPFAKHDHIILNLNNNKSLCFSDPRRFGLFLYSDTHPLDHPLLCTLGPEPLEDGFNPDYLFQKIKNTKKPVKSLIMDNNIVVGVGNIYATESLFAAKIHPKTPGCKLTLKDCALLVQEINKTLSKAIELGGTTLKDFYSFDGKPGYFSINLQVYGKKGQSCPSCSSLIEALNIGGRNSTFCPQCQRYIPV